MFLALSLVVVAAAFLLVDVASGTKTGMDLGIAIATIAVDAPLAAVLSSLLSFHLFLIFQGMTTYEFLTGRLSSKTQQRLDARAAAAAERSSCGPTELMQYGEHSKSKWTAVSTAMSASASTMVRCEPSSIPGCKRLQKRPTVEWETIIEEFQQYEGGEDMQASAKQHPSMLELVSDGESNQQPALAATTSGVVSVASDVFSSLVAEDQSHMIHRTVSSVIFGSGVTGSPMIPPPTFDPL